MGCMKSSVEVDTHNMLANPRFEDSYARLFGPNVSIDESSDAFFVEFYNQFLASPEIARRFANTDMARQIAMLKRSLFQLTSYYVTSSPSAELKRLAEFHRDLNITVEMFDAWLEALIQTVDAMDEEADEATLLAWAWALTPGITYMRIALTGDSR